MKRLVAVLLAFSLLVAGKSFAGEELEPGLNCEIFNIGEEVGDFPDVKDKKATKTLVVKDINVDAGDGEWPDSGGLSEQFYVRWTGVIKIEKDGKYKFFTESDDGSRAFIDGKQVVDNGGLHAAEEKEGEAELKAGDHELKIEFFENGGQASCKFSWEAPGGQKEIVPAKVLFRKKAK